LGGNLQRGNRHFRGYLATGYRLASAFFGIAARANGRDFSKEIHLYVAQANFL